MALNQSRLDLPDVCLENSQHQLITGINGGEGGVTPVRSGRI